MRGPNTGPEGDRAAPIQNVDLQCRPGLGELMPELTCRMGSKGGDEIRNQHARKRRRPLLRISGGRTGEKELFQHRLGKPVLLLDSFYIEVA